jgi:hypothetical protein
MASANVSARVHSTAFTPDFSSLLERTGFTVHGNRANCPFCVGRSRLTVSIGEDVAFCHRCKWTRNLRTLSRELALPIGPETTEQRKARWRGRAFEEWLGICSAILSQRLRRLAYRANWAKVALRYDRDDEAAWAALASFHDNEAELMAALDVLCFEKCSRWLERPISRPELFAAFEEALTHGS